MPTLDVRRIAAAVGIVFLSVVLPFVFVAGAISSALSGKPFGFSASEYIEYNGPTKDGELWHVSAPLFANMQFATTEEFRLRRLDLTTGIDRDTGIVVRGPFCARTFVKDVLFLNTGSGIYGVVDKTVKRVADSPAMSAVLSQLPFEYDDQLTMVRFTDDGGYRLIHLVDGHWIDGRKVLFPGAGRFWYRDDERDRLVLLPLTSKQPLRTTAPGQLQLSVIQQGQQTHIFVAEYPNFSAYRNGFEFADEEATEASAMSPANSVAEVSGWEPIQSAESRDRFDEDQMACDQLGPLFSTWGQRDENETYTRRSLDGDLKPITATREYKRIGVYLLCADPLDSDAYVIDYHPHKWGRIAIRRIQGNVIHPAHVNLPGFGNKYLSRWKRLLRGFFLAWLVHLAIIVGGTAWFTHNLIQATSGEAMLFASVWRRFLALSVDFLPVIILILLIGFTQLTWPQPTTEEVCNRLLDYEKYLAGINVPMVRSSLKEAWELSAKTFFPVVADQWTLFIVVLISTTLLLSTQIILEGRYGITPGKWLLGIRTVSSTGRPCGIARSLLRTILYWIDLSCLITPIPAATSIMLSPSRQRLGDRLADTVVVSHRSVIPVVTTRPHL